jgi:hypothetical protein
MPPDLDRRGYEEECKERQPELGAGQADEAAECPDGGAAPEGRERVTGHPFSPGWMR